MDYPTYCAVPWITPYTVQYHAWIIPTVHLHGLPYVLYNISDVPYVMYITIDYPTYILCMHTYMHGHAHTHTHTRTYTHAHTHTHTHTHTTHTHLGEPRLGPYSGCSLCHIIIGISYVLPNAHARSLRGEFKGQSSQDGEESHRETREVSLRF